jgi:DNA gyrase subunit A
MAKADPGAVFDDIAADIHDTTVSDEVESSYLEYAYSVIHSRALPDVRDGLKPVHRRILFTMREMGLRPDANQVKSARVVGEALGKYHPHGDTAVYDALVRMAQDFSMNATLVHGHGNFGSPNDGAAAMRYTECKLAPTSMSLVAELGESTVDFVPNYDGSLDEPSVLPAMYPNLLVNGTSGIAVGMATNMIPHNLGEVVNAARALIADGDLTLDDLMNYIPGPDLPTGGLLIGADQVRAAYETGRGTVRMRARAEIAPLEGSRGRSAITFTSLPYQTGTEKIIEKIKEEITKKRLTGIADVKDLSDRTHGTRLVVECKTGVNAQALLADLYKYTPAEDSFGINNLALVDGTPRTLGLRDLLTEWLEFRFETVRRRTQHRLDKAEARKHIVEGLLIALDNIDAVVKIIRSSADTAEARGKLIKKFKLTDIQAGHILDMPLRRLVSLEVQSLRDELKELLTTIAALQKILNEDTELRRVVDDELAAIADAHATPRRTELVDGNLKDVLAATQPAGPLEVPDEPVTAYLSTTGLLVRTAGKNEDSGTARARRTRSKHDAIRSSVTTTTRGQLLLITNTGRGIKTNTMSIPPLPAAEGFITARGGISATELADLTSGEHVVGIAPLPDTPEKGAGVAIGTRNGVIKICAPDWPQRSDEFTIITLKDNDTVIHAEWITGNEELVFLTSAASLLHFPAAKVRAQGRNGGGMAGIKLPTDTHVVTFAAVTPTDDTVVVTISDTGTAKITPLAEYPGKGRGTGGVRAHRFLKGETHLTVGFIGSNPHAANNTDAAPLPDTHGRRDGSGIDNDPITHIGTSATQ